MAQTQTQTHLGLGPSWGLKPLEEGLENLSLGPSWGPESLEEESTLAPTWQLKEEKSSHVLMKILCCIMMMFA